jgi:hypothetical protein
MEDSMELLYTEKQVKGVGDVVINAIGENISGKPLSNEVESALDKNWELSSNGISRLLTNENIVMLVEYDEEMADRYNTSLDSLYDKMWKGLKELEDHEEFDDLKVVICKDVEFMHQHELYVLLPLDSDNQFVGIVEDIVFDAFC